MGRTPPNPGPRASARTAPKRSQGPGRPRSFDPDLALDRAMRIFWRQGFEGTSLADLTESMGINRPSLYAAFGDKAALFQRAVERYVALHASYVDEALQEPTARRVVERVWRGCIAVV